MTDLSPMLLILLISMLQTKFSILLVLHMLHDFPCGILKKTYYKLLIAMEVENNFTWHKLESPTTERPLVELAARHTAFSSQTASQCSVYSHGKRLNRLLDIRKVSR